MFLKVLLSIKESAAKTSTITIRVVMVVLKVIFDLIIIFLYLISISNTTPMALCCFAVFKRRF